MCAPGAASTRASCGNGIDLAVAVADSLRHKLATALMRLALDSKSSDFSFYSWTPVLAAPVQSGTGWTLKTSKGDISAARVILATNAYTGTFFAKDDPLHSHIQPFRGQAATITPTPTYAGQHALRNTYNTKQGHYLVTTASGEIVLGGGWGALIKSGELPEAKVFGETNDGPESIDPALTKGAWVAMLVLTPDLKNFMKDNFANWGDEAFGEGLTRTWTGIMSTSKDWLPLVGEVPGKAGLSVVAGVSGVMSFVDSTNTIRSPSSQATACRASSPRPAGTPTPSPRGNGTRRSSRPRSSSLPSVWRAWPRSTASLWPSMGRTRASCSARSLLRTASSPRRMDTMLSWTVWRRACRICCWVRTIRGSEEEVQGWKDK